LAKSRTLIVNALRLAGKRTAMGRHVEMLCKHWSNMDVPFERIVIAVAKPTELSELGNKTKIDVQVLPTALPNLVWEQVILPHSARHASVLFCPAYTCPLIYPGRIVLANHGIYEALPQEFPLKERLRATPINWMSARRADFVIANSLSTKGDLVKFFGMPEKKLGVVLPAASDLCWESYSREEIRQEVVQAFGADVPYVIFVGKMAKRRNVPNLIEAFAAVKSKHSLPHRLLLIGPNTSQLPLDQLIATAGGAEVVRHMNHAEMLPLAKLYTGADVYALPTTYEGISQTMFEAMACGTAVLTVDHPTLAEGGGDAVLSMPTPSVEDLSRGLEQLLLDKDFRRKVANLGKKRASRFSWRETAQQTLAILDRAALMKDSY
jgi:glycosyltransferase involved in cell wall biosynthesis